MVHGMKFGTMETKVLILVWMRINLTTNKASGIKMVGILSPIKSLILDFQFGEVPLSSEIKSKSSLILEQILHIEF